MLSKPTLFTLLCAALYLVLCLVAAAPWLAPFEVGNALPPDADTEWMIAELRFSRLFLVLVIGASLAMMGALYQSVLRNPLAEPYILGVSSAVILGILGAEFFLGLSIQSKSSYGCGLLAAASLTAALLLLARRHRTHIERLLLFGMGANFVFSSLVFLLLSAQHKQVGSGSIRWLFGRIPWWTAEQVAWVAIPSLVFCAYSLYYARSVDALAFGDKQARALGYSPSRIRATVLALVSFWLVLLVPATGAIGFVGLVVPHCVRLWASPQSGRSLLLLCAVGGGVFLGISDSASRLIAPPLEFPIGILTTLLGGPLFLLLLWRER